MLGPPVMGGLRDELTQGGASSECGGLVAVQGGGAQGRTRSYLMHTWWRAECWRQAGVRRRRQRIGMRRAGNRRWKKERQRGSAWARSVEERGWIARRARRHLVFSSSRTSINKTQKVRDTPDATSIGTKLGRNQETNVRRQHQQTEIMYAAVI